MRWRAVEPRGALVEPWVERQLRAANVEYIMTDLDTIVAPTPPTGCLSSAPHRHMMSTARLCPRLSKRLS